MYRRRHFQVSSSLWFLRIRLGHQVKPPPLQRRKEKKNLAQHKTPLTRWTLVNKQLCWFAFLPYAANGAEKFQTAVNIVQSWTSYEREIWFDLPVRFKDLRSLPAEMLQWPSPNLVYSLIHLWYSLYLAWWVCRNWVVSPPRLLPPLQLKKKTEQESNVEHSIIDECRKK